ncbi:FtsW/RodA/SpoVE family cell cycle protein [Coprothermobacter platensis]|uniref:FtsW/RodA/SpoVE family cell cycle protein n=1 Tax=Coprothermobacter platensis TaxID=108819 RepID=UPI0003691163|nr:FtsW/RodA/SpoVE family cell cycle protein [Coprothermobacter platensis]
MTKLLQVLSVFLLIVIVFLFGLITWQTGTVTAKNVLLYIALMAGVYWFAFFIVYGLRKTNFLGSLQWIVGGLTVVALSMTLMIGEVRYGSKRWLYGVQTSELAKGLLLPMFFKSNGTYVVIGLISSVLVILQPDLGTGLVILCSIGIAWFLRAQKNRSVEVIWMILMALIILVPSVFCYSLPMRQQVVSKMSSVPIFYEHWEDRFQNWADPLRDPFGESYQTLSALSSLGQSAGFGKGIGLMTSLPVSWSDYAFAEMVRKYGILSGLLLLLLFGALLEMIINWGGRSKYYVASVMALHIIINLYTVANVLPATGIPLPFVGRALQNSIVLSAMIGATLGEA